MGSVWKSKAISPSKKKDLETCIFNTFFWWMRDLAHHKTIGEKTYHLERNAKEKFIELDGWNKSAMRNYTRKAKQRIP